MPKNSKIKKNRVLAFALLLLSLSAAANDFSVLNRGYIKDTVQIKSRQKVKAFASNNSSSSVVKRTAAKAELSGQVHYKNEFEKNSSNLLKKEPADTITGSSKSNAVGNSISLRTTGSNNQTICIGTDIAFINYDITGDNNTVTHTGLPPGVGPSFITQGSAFFGGRPTQVGVYNFTITVSGPGGPPASATGTITVTNTSNPPSISLTSGTSSNMQSVCLNEPITPITYSKSEASVTYNRIPPGVNVAYTATTLTISGTPTTTGSWDFIVNLGGSCGSSSVSGMIEVRAGSSTSLNSGSGSSNQSVCINSAITPIAYNTSGVTGATVSGLPDGVTGSFSGNTISISGTPTTAGVFNYTVNSIGACSTAAAVTGTLTVTGNNSVALTSGTGTNNQSKCSGAAITPIIYTITGPVNPSVNGLPAGVTSNFNSGVLTISGTPAAAGTYNYSISVAGGCGSNAAGGTIVVSLSKTITLSSASGTDNQSKNINTPINTITYTTTGADSADFSGLPNGVTGHFLLNTVTISGTPTMNGTYNYTVSLNGECAPVTAQGTIIVADCTTITGIIKIIKTTPHPFLFSNPGKTTSALACNETAFPLKFYSAAATLAVGTQLFTNEPLTTKAASAGLWYQLKDNATSYKIDSTGKITETYSCSPTACNKRFLSFITVVTQQPITINYFLPNGTEVNVPFEPVPNGGDQIKSISVGTCIDAASVTIDGPVVSQEISWNDNNNCCEAPATQTYWYQAGHAYPHPSAGYVIYIDSDGIQQTYPLSRPQDSSTPCEAIVARSIVSTHDVLTCTPTTQPTSHAFYLTNPGREAASQTCASNTYTNTFYAASAFLGIGTQMFTEPTLTNKVGSGNLWYKSAEDGIAYRIDNNGQVAQAYTCTTTPPTTTYSYKAVHPMDHTGTDSVTYVDAAGVTKTRILPRSENVGEAPCIAIEAQRIIDTVGALSCDH